METFSFASGVRGYDVFQDLLKPSVGEKLVAKGEFNNTMDKHAVKAEKGDETVGHLPHQFSRIMWYFLARSEEISVEVIGCGQMEVPCQLEFNFSNKVQMKLLKELQWNLDLMKSLGTGQICSLNRGFVISKTSIWRIWGETTKMFVISRS